MPSATHGEARVHISVAPERVYALIGDVERMGQWSLECYRCEWLDETRGPRVGAQFRGHNKLGPVRWQTTCVVTAAHVGREFAFTVVHDNGREETRWRYLLTPDGSGTELIESYQFLWRPIVNRISELLVPRDRQLRRGIQQTLERIKSAAEAGQGADGASTSS